MSRRSTARSTASRGVRRRSCSRSTYTPPAPVPRTCASPGPAPPGGSPRARRSKTYRNFRPAAELPVGAERHVNPGSTGDLVAGDPTTSEYSSKRSKPIASGLSPPPQVEGCGLSGRHKRKGFVLLFVNRCARIFHPGVSLDLTGSLSKPHTQIRRDAPPPQHCPQAHRSHEARSPNARGALDSLLCRAGLLQETGSAGDLVAGEFCP
jgi:hypothetical protein